MCVDHLLSLLQAESGSLTRLPHGQEVVTSYHLGPPQTDGCWTFVDVIVSLSFLFLS